jgi:hypothetical protein
VSLVGLLAPTVLLACSNDDDGSSATSAATEAPSSSPSTAEGSEECAWATRADEETLNIAYPDTGATYWGVSYELAPGETLELRGTFPAARYASFISYRLTGGAIDVLTDRDIEPDEGSANPFAGGDPDGPHAYTVVISGDEAAADDPNVIGAKGDAAAEDPATTTTAGTDGEDPTPAILLGSGGDDAVRGTTLLRVYLPDDADDPTGGVGLPDVSVRSSDGTVTEVPTCPEPGASPNALAMVEANGPPTDRPAPPQPIFVRPEAGAARLYPNPDNVYIATIVEHEPGRLVVVRGLAPTFPDTAGGAAVGGDEQVRYWSMCTNEYRKPYPVTACAADEDTVLDGEGRYTYVISTPEDRPANATETEGVTWLDWGSTEVNNLLLLRHMLASPDFDESAINLEPGALATTTMGAYAPEGAYCTVADFESGGADGCLAGAG